MGFFYSSMRSEPIRVLAIMEASSVTGPAKNLIEFSCQAFLPDPELPRAAVSIITFQRGPLEPENAFVAAVRHAGLPAEVIAERFRFDWSVASRLKAVVDRVQPHLIQSHNSKSHLLVRLTGLWRHYPWIAFHHGYTAVDLKDKLYNQADRLSLPAARCVVTVCGAFSEKLQRIGVSAERIQIRHNMVRPLPAATPQQIAELRSRLAIPPEPQVILSVGRLSSEKGHLDLVEALGIVRRRRPDLPFRCVVVGGGPQRRQIERRCIALGLADWITLAGYQGDVAP